MFTRALAMHKNTTSPLDLFQETGSRGGEAGALSGAEEALLAIGQPAQARTRYTSALTFARETGNRCQQARAYHGLAAACHAVGQIDQTRQRWQHVEDIYTELGVPEAGQVRASPVSVAETQPAHHKEDHPANSSSRLRVPSAEPFNNPRAATSSR
jgi:hypothetical protein